MKDQTQAHSPGLLYRAFNTAGFYGKAYEGDFSRFSIRKKLRLATFALKRMHIDVSVLLCEKNWELLVPISERKQDTKQWHNSTKNYLGTWFSSEVRVQWNAFACAEIKDFVVSCQVQLHVVLEENFMFDISRLKISSIQHISCSSQSGTWALITLQRRMLSKTVTRLFPIPFHNTYDREPEKLVAYNTFKRHKNVTQKACFNAYFRKVSHLISHLIDSNFMFLWLGYSYEALPAD